MTTIIERDVSRDSDNGSSAATMLVAIVAIVIVVGLVLFALRVYPFNGAASTNNGSTPIDINVNGNLPTNPGTTQP